MTDARDLATDLVTRTVYATDNSIYQIEPHGVAVPGSAAEVAALVARNHRSETRRPIVARGGGTGTNGQSLTDGIAIDVRRRLNRIIAIDPVARTAVVEPGVVAGQLNAALAEHDLFWAPHTSTLNRATVGGMISTDAAGKGSLVFGRAHNHVLELDVVLADGSEFHARPVPVAEAERLASQGDATGALWSALLELPLAEGDDHALPELARGFSGYGIDRVRHDGLIDPVPLLVGAEGTLAVITRATLRLTPLPAHTLLIVASYDSFADALDDAVDLASLTSPTAIETFDETTLDRGRASPAWPALGKVVGDHRGSVLLLEYTSSEPIDAAPIEAALTGTGRHRARRTILDPDERADAWKVRADAVGLLAKVATGGPQRSARPTAMVEDCAVPVARMGHFIAEFRSLLDGFGLDYAMFGHADVGCVHVRPALDTTDPEHERLVRRVTDAVVDLVAAHQGVLWGEHGRGFRGGSAERFLSADTIAIMRAIKTAFDPDDLLNPGKLYRPLASAEPVVAVDEPPLRGQVDRRVPIEVRQEFSSAFACNGNGLCHHYDSAEVMCPSYKVTGDPALSPKGRADLLRAWLAQRESDPNPAFEDAIAANLHECLSCSACTGHCPVAVDIPELKSRFLDAYYATRRRPAAHAILSRFEQAAVAGARFGPVGRLGAPLAGRLLGLVDLPVPPRGVGPAPRRFDARTASADEVVILADVFTATLEPSTLRATTSVLERLGYRVSVSPFVGSGKFDHVKGRRAAFTKTANRQAALVADITAAGATATVIEPAVALLHHHEYPAVSARYPSGDVQPLVDLIDARSERLGEVDHPQPVALLGHCTERATAPSWLSTWARLLESVGHTVRAPDLGCCGMAGIFGHERENREMSSRLYEQGWARAVADAGTVAATGYSCRSQMLRHGAAPPSHPVHLL